ncbi:MAG TPA: hemerythrin domain-containing protein [Blastocatellia bacterium]|nr:hemerythrin domain-containing protein [Blastocatellia bacterium]
MNATEILNADHEHMLSLIDEVELAEPESGVVFRDPAKFDRLTEALRVHTAIEERVFYPAMRTFDGAAPLVFEACRDHRRIDALLAHLSTIRRSSGRALNRLRELKDHIREHIKDEQEQLIPIARALLGDKALQALGQKMERLTQSRAG